MQQLFGLALALGLRAARPLDVGPRSGVGAIEKQDAGPDVDRELVTIREVMIETDEQQLLDFRIAIRSRRGCVDVCDVAAIRL